MNTAIKIEKMQQINNGVLFCFYKVYNVAERISAESEADDYYGDEAATICQLPINIDTMHRDYDHKAEVIETTEFATVQDFMKDQWCGQVMDAAFEAELICKDTESGLYEAI